MADNISAKIKLEGEGEFRRSVKSANAEMKAMNAELKLMASEAKAQGKSLQDMAGYQDKMTKATKTAEKTVKAYSDALDNARKQQEKVSNELAKYGKDLEAAQKKLDSMKASGTATSKELKEQEKVVKDLNAVIEGGKKTYQDAADRISYWEKGLADARREEVELKNTTVEVKDAQENLNEAIGNVSKWEALKEMASMASQYLIDFSKASLEAAESYETGLAKIRSIAGASYDLQQAKNELLDLSVAYGLSVDDLSEATYQAMSASVDAAQATRFVEQATKLARGGFTDTTKAVDVLTTVINAYGMEASDAAHISDVLVTTQNRGKTTVDQLAESLGTVIPTAAAYGVELENLAAMYITLTRNGVNTANATTMISGLLTELGKEGSKVSDILRKRTGKTFGQLTKSGASLGDVMGILLEEVDGNSEAFANLWSNVRAARGALQVAQGGVAEYNAEIQALNNSTGIADEAFSTMADTSEVMAAKLDASMQKALIAVGDTMVPFENYMREMGINVLNWFADALNSLPEDARNAIGAIMSIGSVAAQAAPQVMALVTQIATLKAAMALTGGGATLAGIGASIATFAAPLAVGIAAGVAAFKYFEGKIKELEELTKEETALANSAKTVKKEFEDAAAEAENLRNGAYATATAEERAAMAAELLGKMQKSQTAAQKNYNKVNKETAGTVTDVYEAAAMASNDLAFFGLATQKSNFQALQLSSTLRDSEAVLNDQSDTYTWLEAAAHAYNIEAADLEGTSAELRDRFLEEASALGETTEIYATNVQQMDALTNSHLTAKAKIQSSLDEIEGQMAELTAAYEASRESFTNTFNGIFSIWDRAPEVQRVSMDEILGNLQSQTQYFDTYYGNMKKAIENGYSPDFVNSLNDGSQQSAAILATMAEDTEGKYAQMVSAEYAKQQESVKNLSEYSANVATNFNQKYQQLETAQKAAIREMDQREQMYQSQVQTLLGGIQGITDLGPKFVAQYARLADDATRAFKDRLQIESPSKVFERLGEYTVEGAIQGVENMSGELYRAYSGLGALPAAAYEMSVDIPDTSGIIAGPQVINQVHVYLGDQELTDVLAGGVIQEISSQQRVASAYAGGM